jgi:hypothetical protein
VVLDQIATNASAPRTIAAGAEFEAARGAAPELVGGPATRSTPTATALPRPSLW